MTSSPHVPHDPRFPNLRADVVRGYLDAPEHSVAEVLDGELFVMPRPRPTHARVGGELHGELRGPFDLGRGGPGGWILLAECELHLGLKPDIVVPDIAGWHRNRLSAAVFDNEARGAISIAPDWVCEVLSDGTEAVDRGKKRRIFRREGVGHYWLLDPRDHMLEVYRLEQGRWVEAGEFSGEGIVRAEPFDAVDLDLSILWRL